MDTVDEVRDAAEQSPEPGLATGVTAALEHLIGLFRSLSPPDGLSLTAAATLATLERTGPRRLTTLAAYEGVTQPAMTQLVDRLQGMSLLERTPDPADGRVVQVRLTDKGLALLARRRAVRAERVAQLLQRLSPGEQALLTAALPAMNALANVQRIEGWAGPQKLSQPAPGGQAQHRATSRLTR